MSKHSDRLPEVDYKALYLEAQAKLEEAEAKLAKKVKAGKATRTRTQDGLNGLLGYLAAAHGVDLCVDTDAYQRILYRYLARVTPVKNLNVKFRDARRSITSVAEGFADPETMIAVLAHPSDADAIQAEDEGMAAAHRYGEAAAEASAAPKNSEEHARLAAHAAKLRAECDTMHAHAMELKLTADAASAAEPASE